MKLTNFVKGVTRGFNENYRIENVAGKRLIPKKDSAQLFLDLYPLDKDLSFLIGNISTNSESDKEIHLPGFLKISAQKYKTYGVIPNLIMSFNGCRLSGWSYARRGFHHTDFQFLVQTGKSFSFSDNLNKEYGRTALLISDLAERGCSLEFPALLVAHDESDINVDARIYSPIPNFEILLPELKLRKCI